MFTTIKALFIGIANIGTIKTLISNYSLIKKIFLDFESIVKQMLASKPPLPSCENTKLLLDDIKLLVDAGLITIPSVSSERLSHVLMEIEGSIQCKVNEAKK